MGGQTDGPIQMFISCADKAQMVLKLCQKWSMWRFKMVEMRGEVEKKTPKKELDNPSFVLPDTWWFLTQF